MALDRSSNAVEEGSCEGLGQLSDWMWMAHVTLVAILGEGRSYLGLLALACIVQVVSVRTGPHLSGTVQNGRESFQRSREKPSVWVWTSQAAFHSLWQTVSDFLEFTNAAN